MSMAMSMMMFDYHRDCFLQVSLPSQKDAMAGAVPELVLGLPGQEGAKAHLEVVRKVRPIRLQCPFVSHIQGGKRGGSLRGLSVLGDSHLYQICVAFVR
jgi:hypothetical protein